MADENTTGSDNATPRPAGIRPITIKPITLKPSVPEAPKPAVAPAPAPEQAAEKPAVVAASPSPAVADKPAVATNAAPPSEAPARPAGIRPITIGPVGGNKPLADTGTSQTIRLKPVVAPAAVSAPPPVAAPAPAGAPLRPETIKPPVITPASDAAAAAKGKTSRISLDAALVGGDKNVPGGMNFKTASADAPVGKITSNLTGDAAKIKGQTSKVALSTADLPDDPQPTRKRTLRVKAPGRPAAAPTAGADISADAPTVKRKQMTIKPSGGAAAAADAEAGGDNASDNVHISAFPTATAKEKTNVVFPIFGFAAVAMIIAVIVVFMSQACGPDRSLTAFSSFPGGPNITLPGQVGGR